MAKTKRMFGGGMGMGTGDVHQAPVSQQQMMPPQGGMGEQRPMMPPQGGMGGMGGQRPMMTPQGGMGGMGGMGGQRPIGVGTVQNTGAKPMKKGGSTKAKVAGKLATRGYGKAR